MIAVNAYDHPELDEWVWEHARDEAAKTGVEVGEYLGRETVLGSHAWSDLCCHLFGKPEELPEVPTP